MKMSRPSACLVPGTVEWVEIELSAVILHCDMSEHNCLCTVMRRLTTAIRSEKCVVRRFRRCANVIQCTYTNLDSTV
jgi:hypothetical protein